MLRFATFKPEGFKWNAPKAQSIPCVAYKAELCKKAHPLALHTKRSFVRRRIPFQSFALHGVCTGGALQSSALYRTFFAPSVQRNAELCMGLKGMRLLTNPKGFAYKAELCKEVLYKAELCTAPSLHLLCTFFAPSVQRNATQRNAELCMQSKAKKTKARNVAEMHRVQSSAL